jgi:DNA sulfur modification protein DndE
MTIEHVRVSDRARDQLITLKRRTGIMQWNVLCRWAFCVSLAEPTPPPRTAGESTIELMNWKTFGGPYADLYLALLKQRCTADGVEMNEENLGLEFRHHLHRGIGYLFGDRNFKDIRDLVRRTVQPEPLEPVDIDG